MARIFISYRRADSGLFTERIHDRLALEFGKENVFLDVDGHIPPGSNFPDVLRGALDKADMTLVIIGPAWVNIREAEKPDLRRLDNPADFVRIEVESCLSREDHRVIPVLVDGAKMPGANDLPEMMRPLTQKQGIVVRRNPDFHDDMSDLIGIIEREMLEKADRIRRQAEAEEAERRKQAELTAQTRQIDSTDIARILGYPAEWVALNRDGKLSPEQLKIARGKLRSDLPLYVFMIILFSSFGLAVYALAPQDLRVLSLMCSGFLGLMTLVYIGMLFRIIQKWRTPSLQTADGKLENVHQRDKISFTVGSENFSSPYTHQASEFTQLRTFEGQNARAYYTKSSSTPIFLSMELDENPATNTQG